MEQRQYLMDTNAVIDYLGNKLPMASIIILQIFLFVKDIENYTTLY